MQMMIAQMMACPPEKLSLECIGLNHLVWAHRAWIDGVDVTKEVLKKVGDGQSFSMNNISEEPWDPDFLTALGAIPCPYHRYFYQVDAMLAEEKESANEGGTRLSR